MPEPALRSLPVQPSTATLVANAVREAILSGQLEGGQALRQDQIAAEFALSATPVREALRQLEAEGLVVFYPNRGAVVAELSPQEVHELYVIRIALETTALRHAVPKLTPADLERARAAIRATQASGDPAEWGAQNWAFHAALYAAADMPKLLTMTKSLHDNVDRYLRMAMSVMQHKAQSQREHGQLLEACAKGDADAACSILEAHIRDAGERVVAFLETRSVSNANPQSKRGAR
jgi:DNA-binding GntR family transcriptional regulator